MATLRLDQLYTPGSSDKVLELERDLGREIAELISELEENEMQRGIAPRITGYVKEYICMFVYYYMKKLPLIRSKQQLISCKTVSQMLNCG